MPAYTEISACRICGNHALQPILSLGNQALTGVFPETREEKITSGPLEIVKCDEASGDDPCGLVQLRHTFDKAEMYGDRYGYHSGLNAAMVRHLHGLVHRLLAKVQLRPGDLILDIGSNDSTLLQAYPEEGPQLVGIDPTGEKFRKFYPEHIRLIPEFFTAGTIGKHFAGRKARIVTSISMFYDLDSPPEFVNEVYSVLADDGVWMVEQSYLPAMLDANAYDTICHEHLEYYSLRQMKWMADRAGLKIIDMGVDDTNGGSFSLMLAKKEAPYPEAAEMLLGFLQREKGLSGIDPFASFAQRVARHREDLLGFFGTARKKGQKVLGYGASTKGNVILQYCGLTEKDIPAIGEVNEDKFGCFTPGSRIPIIPEKEAKAMKPDYLMVLPWHFREFIVEKEKAYREAGGKLFFPLPELRID